MRLLFILLLATATLPRVARSDERDLREAKRLFAQGRAAYAAHDDARAYDLFKRAFRLSHEPAMLFNMSSAAERLGRPGEAVETLRSYLRLVPDAPDRASIEAKIAVFAEEQRLLDRDKPPPPPALAAPQQPAPIAAMQQPPAEPPQKSHALAIGLGVGGGILALAAGAVAIGFAASSKAPDYTPSTFGTWHVTR